MNKSMTTLRRMALALVIAAGTAGAAGQVQAAELGNNSANIMNGGVIAGVDDATYYANTADGNKLYVRRGEEKQKLSDNSAANINVLGSQVYYLAADGRSVMHLNREDGTDRVMWRSDRTIDEMYVSEEGNIWYLSGGDVFVRNEDGEIAVAVDADSDICHFIPCRDGIIYATGSVLDYTLYANGELIRSNVSTFYDADGKLFLNIDAVDYEAELSELFSGDPAEAVSMMVFHSPMLSASTMGEEEADHCEECEARAAEISDDAVVEDDWELGEETFVMLTSNEAKAALGSNTATASGVQSILYDSSVSEGQRNMVRRAYQQHLVEWTPKAKITGWNSEYFYEAGVKYTGLPYGQPVTTTKGGGYVPWSVSLADFVAKVNDLNSAMYTGYSSYNKKAPSYSTDCSGFVSWSWETSGRKTTSSLMNVGTKVATQSIYSVEIGDAFDKSSSHVVMVSDIGYKSGKIVYIDIIEETPPITKLTRYGTGGSKTLDDLNDKYLGKGYVLIRNPNRKSVSFKDSGAVSLPDDTEGTIQMKEGSVTLDVGKTVTLSYTTNISGAATWKSLNPKVATVDSKGVVTALCAGKATIQVSIGMAKGTTDIIVMPSAVTLVSAAVNDKGAVRVAWQEIPGATSYTVMRKTGSAGWSYVGDSHIKATEFIDSSVAPCTRYTYTVRAITDLEDGSEQVGYYNNTGLTVITPPSMPVLNAVQGVDLNVHKISWSPVANCEGYLLYVKVDGAANWTQLADTTETSFLHEGLSFGSNYTYMVKSYFTAEGKVLVSAGNENGVSRVCALGVPVLSGLTPVSPTSQCLTWVPVEGAEGYNVYVKAGSDTKWTLKTSTTEPEYTATKLTTGVNYAWTVAAYRTVNGKKETGDYNANGIAKVACPVTPVMKSVAMNDASTHVVTWEAVPGVTGYYVYCRDANSSAWTKLGSASSKVTSYTRTKASAGVTYFYMVRSYITSSGKTTLSEFDPVGISAAAAPVTPRLGIVMNVSETAQRVSWGNVPGADGYFVYRKTGSSGWERATITSDTNIVIGGLEAGKNYTYTVRAYVNVNGKTILGDYDRNGITRKATKKLAVPTLKTVTAVNANTLRVTWNAVSDCDGYRLYRKSGSSDAWTAIGTVTGTTYDDTAVACGVKYTYTVRAVSNSGSVVTLSGYNTTGITGNTTLGKVVMKSAAKTGTNTITVTWDKLAGAQSYRVYRRSGTEGWTFMATVSDATWIDRKAETGVEYAYTVRAVVSVQGTAVLGAYDTTGVKGKA